MVVVVALLMAVAPLMAAPPVVAAVMLDVPAAPPETPEPDPPDKLKTSWPTKLTTILH